MGSFTFEAVDGKGNKVKKEVTADDRDEAMAKIKDMGLFPTKVKEKGPEGNAPATAAAPVPPSSPHRLSAGRRSDAVVSPCSRRISATRSFPCESTFTCRSICRITPSGSMTIVTRCEKPPPDGSAPNCAATFPPGSLRRGKFSFCAVWKLF